jgi:hypothetical protein
MRQRVLALSFILKIFQGLLAYMNIILQNRSLSNLEFNHLSIIGNAILLSVFLDFGVGTKFVQNYFNIISKQKNHNEENWMLKYVKSQTPIFTLVAIIQSLFISLYVGVFMYYESGQIKSGLVIATFFTTFVFSLGGLVVKILTARGLISELIIYQLVGIFCQSLITIIAFHFKLNLTVFLFSLAIPNILAAILSLRLVKLKTNLAKSIKMNSEPARESYSISIQLLQLLQFAIGTIPILRLSKQVDVSIMSGMLIQWRVFTSISAALYALNLLEWRSTSLINLSENIVSKGKSSLKYKLLVATCLSTLIVIFSFVSWNYITISVAFPDLFSWILWSIYTLTQVYQWHFYFQLLSLEIYNCLIKATFMQLTVTLGIIEIYSLDLQWIFPWSIFMGILISGIYMQFIVNSNNLGKG